MYKFIIIIVFLLPLVGFSQVSDDFFKGKSYVGQSAHPLSGCETCGKDVIMYFERSDMTAVLVFPYNDKILFSDYKVKRKKIKFQDLRKMKFFIHDEGKKLTDKRFGIEFLIDESETAYKFRKN